MQRGTRTVEVSQVGPDLGTKDIKFKYKCIMNLKAYRWMFKYKPMFSVYVNERSEKFEHFIKSFDLLSKYPNLKYKERGKLKRQKDL